MGESSNESGVYAALKTTIKNPIMNQNTIPALPPFDEHNQHLAANVRPTGWQNPKPDGAYKLVFIGGGTAGLGARVALIERELLGGHDVGNLIALPATAMTHGIGLKQLAETVHPYPTHSEIIKLLGDQYNRTRLTPTVHKLLKRWFA